MFRAIARIFRTPDLRRKIGFTIGIIALFRLGSFIPTPFIDYGNVQSCLDGGQGASGLYELVNLFSGGALSRIALFALGIMPYITASIILQLLTVVVPSLEKLQKEGEVGQQRITQYTRYLTVGLAFGQAIGYVFLFRTFTTGDQEIVDGGLTSSMPTARKIGRPGKSLTTSCCPAHSALARCGTMATP